MKRKGEELATRLEFDEATSLTDWASALGYQLDEAQRTILDPNIRRGILNCCRKWGKSTMIALKAAHFAATTPGATVLVVGPSARQSEELLGIAANILRQLEVPATFAQEKAYLKNRSRILALPNQPVTIRGYSPHLLVVDEAAYLKEEIWDAVFPMLNAAPGGGWLWLMSTPSEPVGFFHRLWENGGSNWTKLKVTAYDCPRIPAAMIEEAKSTFAPDKFAREYLCEFAQGPTAAFPEEMVRACVDPTLPDFFTTPVKYSLPGATLAARPHSYFGNDLGQDQDPSTIAVVEFTMSPTETIDPATRAPLFRPGLALRYLESAALGTPYPEVMERVLRLSQHPRVQGRCTVVVDANGPGAPMVEFMRRTATSVKILSLKTTSGQEAKFENGTWLVPKPMLLDHLEYVLRTKKLRIGEGPLTEAFIRELTLLRREVRDSGYVMFSTSSRKVNDDLAMAVAMAVWEAWGVHKKYLEVEGPVPYVSGAGWLESGPPHPLRDGGVNPLGPRFWDRHRDGR